MFSCLTASTARALLYMANAEFGIQVIVAVVVVSRMNLLRRLYVLPLGAGIAQLVVCWACCLGRWSITGSTLV